MKKYTVKARVEMEVEMIVIQAGKPSKQHVIDHVNDSLKGYIVEDSIVISDFDFEDIDEEN